MNDFASAAMMKLVRDGLARQGIAPPPPTPARDGRVALGDKQALLARLWEQHGPGPVARIGEAIHGVQDDPTLRALVLAVDPPDLLARWQRLERFVHSRHRTRVEAPGPAQLRLQHVSLASAPAPAPAEDLLVIGLLVALCERVLGQGVRARPVGGRLWLRQQGRWRDGPWPQAWHTWDLHWDPVASAPQAPVTEPVASDRWLAQLQARLRADPGRPWRVDDLARACALSARSLQRHLAQRQLGFARLLTEVRVQCAAELLTHSALSVAEVGYRCGFADQPHFSRHFRGCTAVTPARYRDQFSLVR